MRQLGWLSFQTGDGGQGPGSHREDHALWRFSRGEDGGAEATPCTTEAEVVDAISSLLKAEG